MQVCIFRDGSCPMAFRVAKVCTAAPSKHDRGCRATSRGQREHVLPSSHSSCCIDVGIAHSWPNQIRSGNRGGPAAATLQQQPWQFPVTGAAPCSTLENHVLGMQCLVPLSCCTQAPQRQPLPPFVVTQAAMQLAPPLVPTSREDFTSQSKGKRKAKPKHPIQGGLRGAPAGLPLSCGDVCRAMRCPRLPTLVAESGRCEREEWCLKLPVIQGRCVLRP